MAAPVGAACYLGDNTGDLAAFRVLDQLAARGIGTARIAVRSDEAPPELLHAADLTVDAPRARLRPDTGKVSWAQAEDSYGWRR